LDPFESQEPKFVRLKAAGPKQSPPPEHIIGSIERIHASRLGVLVTLREATKAMLVRR
jgi:hypothetical protein